MSGARRLFGLETEYAVAAVADTGRAVPCFEVGGAMLRAAERWLPSLPGSPDPGLFLANGSRLYLDAGDHPEVAGPECVDPGNAVRYLRAGDRIMRRLADEVRRRNPWVASVSVFAGNVDYDTQSTWGAHESYCHRSASADLRRRLLPHLVSRVIYCGAGGFTPRPHGIEFTLSPRAHHLNHVVSENSTHDRGIAHTRDQPLARHGYRRQHLICGESLRSDLAAWLRVGTTALVVALVDGGVACGDEVELDAPVAALRAVAADPTCTRPLRLERGGTATAVEIQRHYLALARAHLGEPFMPAWAEEACQRWGEILDALAEGPDRVSTILDWAIKFAIYRDQVRRRGFEWEALPRALRNAGDSPRDLEAAIRLRGAVLEMDTRWGELGPGSMFEQLDRAGVLDHAVIGVDRIDDAVEQPPAGTRAEVRGSVIRRVQDERNRYWCDWSQIQDTRTGRRLDLSDPFTETETWSAVPAITLSRGGAAARPGGREASIFDEIRGMLSGARAGRRRGPPGSRMP